MQEFAGECTPRLLWVSLWRSVGSAPACTLHFPVSTALLRKISDCAGAAGRFSREQLALLDACVPGGIRYQEPDAQVNVQKVEFYEMLAMFCEALRTNH